MRDAVGAESPTREGRLPRWLSALAPLALLAGLVVLLLVWQPTRFLSASFPPVEQLTIERVALRPGEIRLQVRNAGPSDVTIAQVLVDDSYWSHTVEPSRTVSRLAAATIILPYPWVRGEPLEVKIVSSTGLTFAHRVEVATETPEPGLSILLAFSLLGALVGVVPVLIGLLWRPFLRTLSTRWLHFFLALTAGVLAFLGAEALAEAFQTASLVPSPMGGVGLVTAVAIGTFAGLTTAARWLRRRAGSATRLVVAYSVATGIGLHNFGEGLAIGAAYTLGELALGALLVVGFTVHNVTEGVGIVAVIGRRGVSLAQLALLGLVAGAPAVVGTWTGAFSFSPLAATVFLAVAAGAIAQVIFAVLQLVHREAEEGLGSVESLGGVVTGLSVMYLTGLLVTT